MGLFYKRIGIAAVALMCTFFIFFDSFVDLRTANDLRSEIQQHQEYIRKLQEIIDRKDNGGSNNKRETILDLEDLPSLIGPRDNLPATKSLVVICIGESDKKLVNQVISYFPTSHFSFLLFHYDNSSWSEFAWYDSLDVTTIRIKHKMKYWYIKRFLTPNMAKAFSHIILLDGDVDFEQPFEPSHYLRVADSFNLALSQPAHFKASSTLHASSIKHDGEQIGRYTDFIECGPAVFITSSAYQCIYNLIQTDLTSGWGLDVLWADYLKKECGYGNYSVGILDAFTLIHATPSSAGTASSNAGFNYGAWHELEVYLERFPKIELGWGLKEEPTFGHISCLNSTSPNSSIPCKS